MVKAASSEEDYSSKNDDVDTVDKILARSRKLTLRHAKLSRKLREQRSLENYGGHKDANLLSHEDWLQVLAQKQRFSKSQRD